MLDIKLCKYKKPFQCVYVTKDNVDEFIEKCLPWYTHGGEKIKRESAKVENRVEIDYGSLKQIIFLDNWYVKDWSYTDCSDEWIRCDYFNDEYEIIKTCLTKNLIR